jgi:hypothetical protein
MCSRPLPDLLARGVDSSAADSHPRFLRIPAHAIGRCPRQLYLTILDLTDTSDVAGRFTASHLIQEHFQDELGSLRPDLELQPDAHIDAGRVHIHGRPTCYDTATDTVYHIKPRNGWYRWHPPIQRHLDQLHIYMRGLEADQGRILYVSMADLHDVRPWPPETPLPSDADRTDSLIEHAARVRDIIVADGVATRPGDIPYEPCGCYFCDEETLTLPPAPHPSPDPTPRDSTIPPEIDAGDTDQPADTQPASENPPGADHDPVRLRATGARIPTGFRETNVWVVWDGRSNRVLAPWTQDTMYPCPWNSEAADPRRRFEKAAMVAELSVEQIHRAWPFPDTDDLPDTVLPAVLLPNEPDESPLTVIDFDDVRNPDSGVVSGEVAALLEALDGYAEISQSHTGIHVFVHGGLPTGVTAFQAPLFKQGRIEIYDQSRFIATTWQHVDGTPIDQAPNATPQLRRIVDTYKRS